MTLSILRLYLVISSNICDGKVPNPKVGYDALWLALITLIWVTPLQTSNMHQHIAEMYSVAGTLRDIVVAKCFLLICPDHILGLFAEEYDSDKLRSGWRSKVFGLSRMYAFNLKV